MFRAALLGCGLLLAVLGPRLAHAGALYRCRGQAGETVFSGSTDGYRHCQRISAPGLAGPGRSRSAVPARTPSKASLAGVQASVETTAKMPSPPAQAAGWNYREDAAPQDRATLATVAVDRPGDPVLRGAVYRVARADGSVEYTNIPPAGQKGRVATLLFSYIATCVACNLHSPIRWDRIALNLDAYADIIRAASLESGVNEALLRAVIHAESAFNPRAMSLKGAQGLMQLMPATASEVGVRDAFDVEQNIRGGARYLGYLLRSFNGDERLATAAYNAGESAVQRYRGVPPFAETLVYVQRVGILYQRYRESQGRALGAL